MKCLKDKNGNLIKCSFNNCKENAVLTTTSGMPSCKRHKIMLSPWYALSSDKEGNTIMYEAPTYQDLVAYLQ